MDKTKLICIGAIFLFILIAFSGCITTTNHPPQPSLIRFEDVVWMENKSITEESEVRKLFIKHGMEFWENSLNFVRSHGLYYPGNHTPLFSQMGIDLVDFISVNGSERWGPPQWTVVVPAINENARWRVGSDGIIEEKKQTDMSVTNEETGEEQSTLTWEWCDAAHIWFLIEQKKGIVKVIC